MESGKRAHGLAGVCSPAKPYGLNRYQKPELKSRGITRMEIDEIVEFDPSYFPVMKAESRPNILPGYTAVLNRNASIGIKMQDLDLLQHDFEKLLSVCNLRYRMLKGERSDKIFERLLSQPPLKKLKMEEPTRMAQKTSKDSRDGGKVAKGSKLFALPFNNSTDITIRPKLVLPRNEVSENFWAFVDVYTEDVTSKEMHYLESVLRKFSKLDLRIPELGEAIAAKWTEGLEAIQHVSINSSPKENNINNITQKPIKTEGKIKIPVDIKKLTRSCILDTFSNPLTQRLFDSLIEERVIGDIPNTIEALKPADFAQKAIASQRPKDLDRRLRKELLDLGIIDVEDLPKTYPQDEILMEIRKCHEELIAVNQLNKSELHRLQSYTARGLERRNVRFALERVDTKIVNIIQDEDITDENLEEVEMEALIQTDEQSRLHHILSKLSLLPLIHNNI